MLAVFTVDSLDDFEVFASGEAPGTLRQAIFDANLLPDEDTIEFVSGLSGVINLEFGELQINAGVTIQGPGADTLAIDALNNSRVFHLFTDLLSPAIEVNITGLTIRGGFSDNDGGGVLNGTNSNLGIYKCTITGNEAANGGGIANAQSGGIYIGDCSIFENNADGLGGGVFSQGMMSLAVSTISGNQSGYGGGGVCASDGISQFFSSTIHGNESTYGGGVYVQPDAILELYGSTISGNSASLHGGGLYNWFGNVSMAETTISGNDAQENAGGMLSIEGSLVVTRSTITNNRADSDGNGSGLGGGIHQFDADSGETCELDHTIVAGNFDPNGRPDLSGAFSATYSLIGDNSGANLDSVQGNIIGTNESPVDPRLGPLGHYGGPTLTHSLLEDSPAIDAGDTALVVGVNVPEFDQRGFLHPRVFDGNADSDEQIDIGAFEFDSVIFIVDTLEDESDGDFSEGDFSLREAIGEAALVTVGFPIIRFDASLFNEGPATILLDFFQQLEITASMDIEGPGADLLTIEVQNFGRAFNVDDSVNGTLSDVSIGGLTITGGNDPNGGGAIFNRERLEVVDCVITGNTAQWGGGLYNDAMGELTVVNSDISGNTATSTGGGGGIYNWGGVAFVFDSVISGNDSGTTGGGVLNTNNGTVTIVRTTISGNDAVSGGGGLFNGDGNVHIFDSTFSGNTAENGGGIYSGSPNNDAIFISNSTISNNVAPLGGAGVYNFSGRVAIQFSTVTENNSNDFAGSGVVTWGDPAFATTEIYSTIIAGNHHTDVAVTGGFIDTFESLGYNVIGTGSVDAFDDPGDWVIETADPGLGPLADNGGPTMTHALLSGSPAIDQGDSSLVLGGLVPFHDQRGISFDRIRDGNGDTAAVIDVGAFELEVDVEPTSADFDGDGDVDGRDFLAWQRGFGTIMAEKDDGDADNNGTVDGDDLGVWANQYGSTPSISALNAAGSALVIAESLSVEAEVNWQVALDAAMVLAFANESEEPEPLADVSAPVLRSTASAVSEPAQLPLELVKDEAEIIAFKLKERHPRTVEFSNDYFQPFVRKLINQI